MDFLQSDVVRRLPDRSARNNRDAQMLAVVSDRTEDVARLPIESYVSRLVDACLAEGTQDIVNLMAEMSRDGIREDEVAEVYVPMAARALGKSWCSDGIGFAHVTIGCARLHGVLRSLNADWDSGRGTDPHAASLLVMVGSDAQHTLGATVLARTLRRRGFVTKLLLDPQIVLTRRMLRKSSFDAVLISASCGEKPESIRRLVDAARLQPSRPPVVIGGTIIEGVRGGAGEILARTGADFFTSDPSDALKLCGLTVAASSTGWDSSPANLHQER